MSDAAGATPTPCGLLLIDKPTGPTSMDVCARVRSRLRRGGAPKRVRVGHAGTLDPMATGLLVVMVGKATRLCESLMGEAKAYETTVDLSRRSSTDDAEGTLQEVPVARHPTREEVERACLGMTGVVMQKPPAFSAISVGGVRAYDAARKGKPLDLPARPVRIDAIEVRSYEFPLLRLRVLCGKGVYIRSIARDLGVALGGEGAGGMLTQLRRTRSGAFDVSSARPLDSLPEVLTQADLLPPPDGAAPQP